MTFYSYMMRKYKGDDSPKGDFAEDIKRTSESFPRNNPHRFDLWFGIIYDYLVDHDACHGCLRAFSECWGEYMAYEESKKRRKNDKEVV